MPLSKWTIDGGRESADVDMPGIIFVFILSRIFIYRAYILVSGIAKFIKKSKLKISFLFAKELNFHAWLYLNKFHTETFSFNWLAGSS